MRILISLVMLVALASSVEARDSGRVIKSPNDLPHVGLLVGKTVCVTIKTGDTPNIITTQTCSKVSEAGRHTFGELPWVVEMKVHAAYWGQQGAVVHLQYYSREKGWEATIDRGDRIPFEILSVVELILFE